MADTDDPAGLADDLRDLTYQLDDLCLAFRRRWAQRNERQWSLVSRDAFTVIALIAEKMLPPARARMAAATQVARTNWTALDRDAGYLTSPVTAAAQLEHISSLPLGSAVLPETPAKIDVSLLVTLECLSRMNSTRVNFRLEDGRHIVLFGLEEATGAAPGILELDMGRFCELLLVGIEEL